MNSPATRAGNPPACPPKIRGQNFGLPLVRTLVDEDAGGALDLAGPQVALPSPDANEAQIIEIDVAVMALPNVPKQDRLAHSVIRGLGKGAWARDGAAAVVKPVSRDTPDRGCVH